MIPKHFKVGDEVFVIRYAANGLDRYHVTPKRVTKIHKTGRIVVDGDAERTFREGTVNNRGDAKPAAHYYQKGYSSTSVWIEPITEESTAFYKAKVEERRLRDQFDSLLTLAAKTPAARKNAEAVAKLKELLILVGQLPVADAT